MLHYWIFIKTIYKEKNSALDEIIGESKNDKADESRSDFRQFFLLRDKEQWRLCKK